MNELVVVIPGIGGSQLADPDGTVLWNASWSGLAAQTATWGRRFTQLTLPTNDNDDGMRPSGLVDGLAVIPGFWSYGSYKPLTNKLRRRFGNVNVAEFAYDWRRSNDDSAARLAELLESRNHGREDRQVVLIAHSMGGLVARRYLTHHGGARRCRLLITIGTPYQGAAKALERLANGIPKLPGTFGERLVSFLRSCPSVYELLPLYNCFEQVGRQHASQRYGLATWLPAALDRAQVKQARTFHEEMAAEIADGKLEGVDSAAVIGHRQETSRYATVNPSGSLELRPELWVGDGTVPEGSAKPPEWGDTVRGSLPFWATHVDLPSSNVVFRAVEGLISGHEYSALGPDDDVGLSLSLPDVATPDERITIRVRTRGDDLSVVVAAVNDGATPYPPVIRLTARRDVPFGDERLVEYEGSLGPLAWGVHHVIARTVTGGAPHQVSGTVTVFPSQSD